MTLATDLAGNFAKLQSIGGTSITITDAGGANPRTVVGLVETYGRDDELLANEFGLETKKLYLPPMANPPNKMDKAEFMGQKWGIKLVRDELVLGTIICHLCIIKRGS